MFAYVTQICPRCGSKFTFHFSYLTIPPQFCDNCRRELMLKSKHKFSDGVKECIFGKDEEDTYLEET